MLRRLKQQRADAAAAALNASHSSGGSGHVGYPILCVPIESYGGETPPGAARAGGDTR
jgi:hypothetical protein